MDRSGVGQFFFIHFSIVKDQQKLPFWHYPCFFWKFWDPLDVFISHEVRAVKWTSTLSSRKPLQRFSVKSHRSVLIFWVWIESTNERAYSVESSFLSIWSNSILSKQTHYYTLIPGDFEGSNQNIIRPAQLRNPAVKKRLRDCTLKLCRTPNIVFHGIRSWAQWMSQQRQSVRIWFW